MGRCVQDEDNHPKKRRSREAQVVVALQYSCFGHHPPLPLASRSWMKDSLYRRVVVAVHYHYLSGRGWRKGQGIGVLFDEKTVNFFVSPSHPLATGTIKKQLVRNLIHLLYKKVHLSCLVLSLSLLPIKRIFTHLYKAPCRGRSMDGAWWPRNKRPPLSPPHKPKVAIFLKQFLHYCFSASFEASLPSTTVFKLFFGILLFISHSSRNCVISAHQAVTTTSSSSHYCFNCFA